MADPRTGSSCHCISLRRAANALSRHYDRCLEDSGLTVNQYSILCSIDRIAPCSVTELAARTRLERTTLVRNLKPLLAADWVRDAAAPGNRRNRLSLTPSGRERMLAAREAWERAQRDVEACFAPEELQTLRAWLLRLEGLGRQQHG